MKKDDQIKYMVGRFLGWSLPKNFQPDAGITYKPIENRHGVPFPGPIGTNLFDAIQAEAMVRCMVEGMPSPPPSDVLEALKDACAHLTAAASAYRKHASRHKSQGRAIADPMFSTRADDFDKAANRLRAILELVEPKNEET